MAKKAWNRFGELRLTGLRPRIPNMVNKFREWFKSRYPWCSRILHGNQNSHSQKGTAVWLKFEHPDELLVVACLIHGNARFEGRLLYAAIDSRTPLEWPEDVFAEAAQMFTSLFPRKAWCLKRLRCEREKRYEWARERWEAEHYQKEQGSLGLNLNISSVNSESSQRKQAYSVSPLWSFLFECMNRLFLGI